MLTRMDVDLTIVGAGVVGLAVAAEVAREGRRVLVLERHGSFGRETSSRNSEVIHAGLYYPQGSLKAQTCVEGRDLLYELCEKEGLAHRRIGKLIVATESAEDDALDSLLERAQLNGVTDLVRLTPGELSALEPNVRAHSALLSPSTGIVSSHELMAFLEARATEAGADVAYCTDLQALGWSGDGIRVTSTGPDRVSFEHSTACLVNAAGLHSDRVAELAGIDVDDAGYRLSWWKGNYFSLTPSCAGLVNHLVYPAPTPRGAGLGIHLTLDVAGRLRLGPDAELVQRDSASLSVDPALGETFFHAARRFLPWLEPEHLSPEQAGFRAKLSGQGEALRDFVLQEESARGCPGLINLIGIDSPGLTASLSLARRVNDLLEELGLHS